MSSSDDLTDPQCAHLPGHLLAAQHGPSRWVADRWSPRNRGKDGTYWERWLEEWGEPPRTCSFCGGAHPEDVLRLMRDGWEVGVTGKPHKRYLNPPGTEVFHNEFMGHIRRREAESAPDFAVPLPPVKVYTYHFSQEHIDEFNRILGELDS